MFKIVNIDKPEGFTSNDVVQKIKHALGLKKEKIGHLGTLDPFATGVLPITMGKATRLFDYYLNKKKGYVAYFEFGTATDTLDIDGNITETSNKYVSAEQIKEEIKNMLGKQMQVPPMFSAKKIDGQKAYDLARQGKELDLKPREVEIEKFELIEKKEQHIDEISKNAEKQQKTVNFKQVYAFEVICSSGTYIRALARDLAQKLGTVANVCFLRRTMAGEFNETDCVNLDEFLVNPEKYYLSFDNILKNVLRVKMNKKTFEDFLNGVAIIPKPEIEEKLAGKNFFCVYDGKPVAMCKIEDGKIKSTAFLFDKN